MLTMRHWIYFFVAFCLASKVFGTSIAINQPGLRSFTSDDPSRYNLANAGTPVSQFSAKAGIPVTKLAVAARKAKRVGERYPLNPERTGYSTIYTDWSGFEHGAAYVWIADMDVDCDGIDFRCKNNPDGYALTNFGALAAYAVPFVVIPDRWATEHRAQLPGNNVVAVICDGKLFYGIFGDTNGDEPQVIGEASWRFATACFPKDSLNGNAGHTKADVTYIAFIGKDGILPHSALNANYITNFTKLRTFGDKLVTQLSTQLEIL